VSIVYLAAALLLGIKPLAKASPARDEKNIREVNYIILRVFNVSLRSSSSHRIVPRMKKFYGAKEAGMPHPCCYAATKLSKSKSM
jgi:hypothetical protein